MTDVLCLVIGILFALSLLFTAIVLHNGDNLARSEFPTDSSGTICALDAKDENSSFPFLFFNEPRNPMGRRFCVEECPQQAIPSSCFGGPC